MTETIEQLRTLQFSVKKDEGGTMTFILPAYDYGNRQALPPRLPNHDYTVNSYYRSRDRILLSTPQYEAQWANAIGLAIAKNASLAWAVESDIALRRNRAHEWLLNAGAGIGLFGWVPFLSAHLRSYHTLGRAFIEIERATPANGSKVVNIHHLNPLRCRITGDNRFPVNYLSPDGKTRKLGWHQVMILQDLTDPTEGEMGLEMSAAERAYPQIIKLAAMEWYVYEKISGRRPLALHFLGGAVQRQIDDVIASGQEDASRQGLVSYMGAAVAAVPGDVPLSLVTIPLAELPDRFEPEAERLRADLLYANALGLDPQDLNPGLVGRQGLGSTGNQSEVLANKKTDRPLATWRQQFMHQLNQLALDDQTTFTFREADLVDQGKEAENAKLRAETRQIQIEGGEITPDQATNLAVDTGDLPREFIEEDVTGGGLLTDTDQPEREQQGGTDKPEPEPAKPEPNETEKEWSELIY